MLTNNLKKLEQGFFEKDALTVCKNLIGCILKINTKNGEIVARINEIEAYLGVNDKASHSYNNRKTNRTKTMYLLGGHLYVYFIYGMHYNLNFIAEKENVPAGILLRGIELLSGHDAAALNRYNKTYNNLTTYEKKNICNGPGKVCKTFNINKETDAKYYTDVLEVFYPITKVNYKTTKRIGIDYAQEDKDKPYRFVLTNS